MSFKKAIALLMCLILFGCGAYFIIKTEQQDNQNMQKLYTEVEPLERQRETLLEEKKALDTEYAVKSRDYGTLEILFVNPNSQIYTEAWPIMRERGVLGMVCVNMNQMPGGYGTMGYKELAGLLTDGWGICLLVDKNNNNVQTALPIVSEMLAVQNIKPPATVYFKDNTYDESIKGFLKENGIKTVITDAPDGRNTVTDVNGDIWFTGAMPWGYTGSVTDLELLGRTDGGNLVLTYQMNEVWKMSKKDTVESQEKLNFIAVLDSWKEMLYEDNPLDEMESVGPTPYIYVDTTDPEVLHSIYLDSLTPEQKMLMPKFRSSTTDSALEHHRSAQAQEKALANELEQKKTAIDEQLESLNREITAIYTQYNVNPVDNAQWKALLERTLKKQNDE